MLAMLVPILKSKTGDITSTGNFHPIALATVCSKIMETCLVSRLESFYILMIISLHTRWDTQLICVYFSLKEAIRFYTKHHSPVYACFVDASKAFDKLNHWILFNKMKQCGCPVYLVKCLVYWYQKEKLCKVE